jgi:1,4-dihydroxy-6-naphthoate synthase
MKTQRLVAELIRKSVAYSFANYPFISPFVEQHAQAMNKEVMRQHIDLYVNDYSIDLGNEGRKAIEIFYSIYKNGDKGLADVEMFAC